VKWYNVSRPDFSLVYNKPVTSTVGDQKFTIKLNNYDLTQLSKLDIKWSIVPNLTLDSFMNITDQNTVLNVAKGGFAAQTNYTMHVEVKHKEHPYLA
jgi:hypothetical protein